MHNLEFYFMYMVDVLKQVVNAILSYLKGCMER